MDTLLSRSPLKDDKDPEVDVDGERPSLDTADNNGLTQNSLCHGLPQCAPPFRLWQREKSCPWNSHNPLGDAQPYGSSLLYCSRGD